MSQARVHGYSVSLDGFGTGEGQNIDSPFGHAEGRLLEWFMATRTFQDHTRRARGQHRRGRRHRARLGDRDRRGDHGPQQVRPAARPVDRR